MKSLRRFSEGAVEDLESGSQPIGPSIRSGRSAGSGPREEEGRGLPEWVSYDDETTCFRRMRWVIVEKECDVLPGLNPPPTACARHSESGVALTLAAAVHMAGLREARVVRCYPAPPG